MPYIPQRQRDLLDPIIGQFGAVVGGEWAGCLNYIITRLCLMFFNEKPSYGRIASVTGVLENVKQELYRRRFAEYEMKKHAENGDVFQ